MGKERTVYEIQRPKKSLTLPNILSQEEVKGILQSVDNLKHRAVLMLIYSAGLRISEAIKLRNRDIHSDEGYIFIKGAKAKKTERQYSLLYCWYCCGSIIKHTGQVTGFLKDRRVDNILQQVFRRYFGGR